METVKTIWTIGHSTLEFEKFVEILRSFRIEVVADIRHYPGSRKFPQYNSEALNELLKQAGIDYISFVELGGRRKPKPDSKNGIWRSDAFRGYADYMETDAFLAGIRRLTDTARQSRTAYMCAEAVWWRCHRALVSDLLKSEGWQVMHIMKNNTAVEHPYTAAYLEANIQKEK
ncbi:MAG: Fe-S cluster assembly protein HesB [Pedobacter sp.]|nr:Fe-S cluster assembly protein HesB [Pedobacter sp.]